MCNNVRYNRKTTLRQNRNYKRRGSWKVNVMVGHCVGWLQSLQLSTPDSIGNICVHFTPTQTILHEHEVWCLVESWVHELILCNWSPRCCKLLAMIYTYIMFNATLWINIWFIIKNDGTSDLIVQTVGNFDEKLVIW